MAHPGVTSASGIDSIDAGRKNCEFCVIVLKIGYIYVYYTLVLLQIVNALCWS